MRSASIRLTSLAVLAGLGVALLIAGSAHAQGAPAAVGPRLSAALDADPSATHAVWVYLTARAAGSSFEAALSVRSLERRARVFGEVRLDERDRAVDASIVERISRIAPIRQRSRWLNAVSVDADARGVEALATLPYVSRMDLVRRWVCDEPVPASPPAGPKQASLPYGASAAQLNEIHVPEVHDLGYSGAGVLVCMMDTGFMKSHQALATRPLVAEHDFVNHDGDTEDDADDVPGQHNHGTGIWSVLGGYAPGELVGPAYGASFVLAKTEDVGSETRVEEDNYVAGLEWADSLGADVVSASLAYRDFDGGFAYTYAELDGDTAVTTIAVDIAVSRGMVCVNAMGNTGPNPGSLWTPADADSVIACGAVDAGNALANFSSRGPTGDGRMKPEVTARGVATHWASASGGPTAYGDASGTSLSTPLVGGAAALLLEAHPEWTPMQVREALMSTASHAASPDNNRGWGRIHVLNAIASAPLIFPAPFSLRSPGNGSPVSDVRPTFLWARSIDPEGAAVTYTLLIDETPDFASPFVFSGIADTTWTLSTALASAAGYYWKVTASDPESHERASREMFSFSTPDVTGAGDLAPPVALRLSVEPNPSRGAVRFHYEAPSVPRLRVYSVAGRIVCEIGAPAGKAGTIAWDGRDGSGREVPSGFYRAVLEASGVSVERKVVLVQ
jgi:subtilisin family serine protease